VNLDTLNCPSEGEGGRVVAGEGFKTSVGFGYDQKKGRQLQWLQSLGALMGEREGDYRPFEKNK